jgi:hypothetical protein
MEEAAENSLFTRYLEEQWNRADTDRLSRQAQRLRERECAREGDVATGQYG